MHFRNAGEETGHKPRDRATDQATKQPAIAGRRDPSEPTSHDEGLQGRLGRRRKGRGAFAGSAAVSPALERTFRRSMVRSNANDAHMTSWTIVQVAQNPGRSTHSPGACETGERTVMWRTWGGQKGAATLLRMLARHRARLAILRRERSRCEPHRGAAGGGAP